MSKQLHKAWNNLFKEDLEVKAQRIHPSHFSFSHGWNAAIRYALQILDEEHMTRNMPARNLMHINIRLHECLSNTDNDK